MSVLARFLKILAFGLLCGIVGPIFLAVYYFGGPEVRTEAPWMLYTGVATTALTVLVAFLITVARTRGEERHKRLEAEGILATAEVVGVTETSVSVNDQRVIKLSLEIRGDGIAPFRAERPVQGSVLRMPSITARKLVVLVEPGTQNFEIDWQRSALLNGQMPATFESSSERRTYDLSGKSGPLLEIMKVLRANGIGTDGVVDIRSNPVVRQQVDAILRRSAATPAATADVKRSAIERLAELDRLKAASLVSESEYIAKRAQILADL